nr:MAG TPA: hypothetical protein [Caudoviricetes sp.]
MYSFRHSCPLSDSESVPISFPLDTVTFIIYKLAT